MGPPDSFAELFNAQPTGSFVNMGICSSAVAGSKIEAGSKSIADIYWSCKVVIFYCIIFTVVSS